MKKYGQEYPSQTHRFRVFIDRCRALPDKSRVTYDISHELRLTHLHIYMIILQSQYPGTICHHGGRLKNSSNTDSDLIKEISFLNQKVKELEQSESDLKRAEEELRVRQGELEKQNNELRKSFLRPVSHRRVNCGW